MNCKFEIFAEQCTSLEENPFGMDIVVFDKEKFAELIVKECAELFVNQRYMILDPLRPFAEERVRVLKAHDKHNELRILRHFGVE